MSSIKEFSVLPFNCPSCGSYMVHKIGTYNLECINCKSTKAIDTTPAKDNKKPIDLVDTPTINPIKKVVDCPGCGADIKFSEFELAKNCPYCKNPLVTKCVNSIKPESILPFNIDKTKAKDIFKEWIGSLWFAPNKLSNLKDFEHQFSPNYIPYFNFDANTFSTYDGQRGDAYYVEVDRVVYVNGERRVVRELERRIRWSYVTGSVSRYFKSILVDAKKDLPLVIKNLKSFDLNMLVEFNPSFFSGYSSCEYSKELSNCYSEAKDYMKNIIYKDVLWDIGGDEQRVFNINTNYSDEKFEVTMIPIWISSFKFKNKEYTIAINGVNGEIVGNRPYSYFKIFALIFTILLIFATLFYLDNNYNIFGGGPYIETDFNKRFNLP